MDRIQEYLSFAARHPEQFRQDPMMPMVLEEWELRAYERETGKEVGLLFTSPWFMLAADLIRPASGAPYLYYRILKETDYDGVVILPILDGKAALIRNYRHGPRSWELELPRGGAEPGLSPAEDAAKELWEEMGARTAELIPLGTVINDTSKVYGELHLFACHIASVGPLQEEECITGVELLTAEDCRRAMVDGSIRDTMTIAALARALLLGLL